jgi:hypothetical protein
MRGVVHSGLWSEVPASASGTGSERTEVASVAEDKPPARRGPRPLRSCRMAMRAFIPHLPLSRGSAASWIPSPRR